MARVVADKSLPSPSRLTSYSWYAWSHEGQTTFAFPTESLSYRCLMPQKNTRKTTELSLKLSSSQWASVSTSNHLISMCDAVPKKENRRDKVYSRIVPLTKLGDDPGKAVVSWRLHGSLSLTSSLILSSAWLQYNILHEYKIHVRAASPRVVHS